MNNFFCIGPKNGVYHTEPCTTQCVDCKKLESNLTEVEPNPEGKVRVDKDTVKAAKRGLLHIIGGFPQVIGSGIREDVLVVYLNEEIPSFPTEFEGVKVFTEVKKPADLLDEEMPDTAENAIVKASWKVEALGAHEKLTMAVTLLHEARMYVADYLKMSNSVYLNQYDNNLSPEENFDLTGLLKEQETTTNLQKQIYQVLLKNAYTYEDRVSAMDFGTPVGAISGTDFNHVAKEISQLISVGFVNWLHKHGWEPSQFESWTKQTATGTQTAWPELLIKDYQRERLQTKGGTE